MKIIICLISLGFLFGSCSQKFSLQKRKYNKGYYFASAKKKSDQKGSELTQKTEQNLQPFIVEKPEEVIVSQPVASADNSIEQNDLKSKKYFKDLVTKENDSAYSEQEESTSAKLPKEKVSKNNTLNNRKHFKKGPLGDFLYNVNMGYYIVSFFLTLIILAIYLLITFPLPVALAYMAVIVIVLLLLAALGRSVS